MHTDSVSARAKVKRTVCLDILSVSPSTSNRSIWETVWLLQTQQTLSQQTNLIQILMWLNKLQKHFSWAICTNWDIRIAAAREKYLQPRHFCFSRRCGKASYVCVCHCKRLRSLAVSWSSSKNIWTQLGQRQQDYSRCVLHS